MKAAHRAAGTLSWFLSVPAILLGLSYSHMARSLTPLWQGGVALLAFMMFFLVFLHDKMMAVKAARLKGLKRDAGEAV